MAHALKELPQISAAFREGRISFSKVRAMTRVATPGNEDYLLMIARHGTAWHVERLVRHYRSVQRKEALKNEKRIHDFRELKICPVEDGSFIVKGRLTPEQGAVLKKALESGMDEDFEERKNVPAETSAEKDPLPSVASRRADALVRMAEAYLSGSSKRSDGGDRYLGSRSHRYRYPQGRWWGRGGWRSKTADAFPRKPPAACPATPVSYTGCKTPRGSRYSVGRKTRSVPPAIRRALKRRDGGCRFPGCSCTRFVDAHHIRHWADGGQTSMDNLVLLCRHHHRLVHEGGFKVEKAAGNQVCFVNAGGGVIPPNGEKRSRGNVFALRTAHARSGIHITPDTTVTLWRGEQMDEQMAVEGLLRRK